MLGLQSVLEGLAPPGGRPSVLTMMTRISELNSQCRGQKQTAKRRFQPLAPQGEARLCRKPLLAERPTRRHQGRLGMSLRGGCFGQVRQETLSQLHQSFVSSRGREQRDPERHRSACFVDPRSDRNRYRAQVDQVCELGKLAELEITAERIDVDLLNLPMQDRRRDDQDVEVVAELALNASLVFEQLELILICLNRGESFRLFEDGGDGRVQLGSAVLLQVIVERNESLGDERAV